ncbi:unnamed protein product [Prunus armeniaca]|uniref:40S ribosomal protein S7 n=1 Tax=Prunus armeniaca TaxID=36596 RepID=A0A6J5WQK9_PRUAR|nr:unnamed protein product [Prunus armeniaca]
MINIPPFSSQVDVAGNRKAVVIRIPYRLRKAYRKIHVRIVRELEKKFNGKCFFHKEGVVVSWEANASEP